MYVRCHGGWWLEICCSDIYGCEKKNPNIIL